MKKNYTLSMLFVMACLLRLGAQNITSSQTDFQMNLKPTELEGHIEAYIKNNSAQDITLDWLRIVTCTSDPVWTSYVCDPNLCYGDDASKPVIPVVIAAGAEGYFTFHVRPQGVAGNAEFQLKIFEQSNPDNNVVLTIKVNGAACASSTTEPGVAAIEVAPNPATDHFRLLDADDNISAVNVMTLDGRRLARLEATPGHEYPFGNFPVANYVLALEDRSGRIVKVAQIKKQ